jgi:hypothetical protein
MMFALLVELKLLERIQEKPLKIKGRIAARNRESAFGLPIRQLFQSFATRPSESFGIKREIFNLLTTLLLITNFEVKE